MPGSTFNINHATSQIRIVNGVRYLWLGGKAYLVTQVAKILTYPILLLLGWVLQRSTNRLTNHFQKHVSENGFNLSYNEKLRLYKLLADKSNNLVSFGRIKPSRYPLGFRGLGKSLQRLSNVSSKLVSIIEDDFGVNDHPKSDVFIFSDPTTWDEKAESYAYLC